MGNADYYRVDHIHPVQAVQAVGPLRIRGGRSHDIQKNTTVPVSYYRRRYRHRHDLPHPVADFQLLEAQ
ncbi:hypothetical protein D3C71_1821840 [compost metagenome]